MVVAATKLAAGAAGKGRASDVKVSGLPKAKVAGSNVNVKKAKLKKNKSPRSGSQILTK